MDLIFRIHYNAPGDSVLSLCGDTTVLGNNEQQNAPLMERLQEGWWELKVSFPSIPKEVNYRYTVVFPDGTSITEPSTHSLKDLPGTKNIMIIDRWIEPSYSYVFLTHKIKPLKKAEIALITHSGAVPQGCHLALTGNSNATGMWNPSHAIALQYTGFGNWETALPYSAIEGERLEYKYIVRKDPDNSLVEWEEGNNRVLKLHGFPENEETHIIIRDSSFRGHSEGVRHTGTAIPVFSLRSHESWGIGDFGDLKKMADWVALTGQRVLQILPVNDTTMYHNWIDSYPYGGISIMALHPLYANIKAMCPEDGSVDLSQFEKKRKKLNDLPAVDYDKVSDLKWSAIKLLFRYTGKQVMKSASFKTFIRENKKWLRPYALFCVLRDKFGTADFTQWGKYARYDPVYTMEFDDLDLYIFVQYYLDRQLANVHKYLNSKGIILKGDIPIGITPMSVEAWTEPHLFHMNSQAGAPPDEFSVQGQNWGFPTYNWEVMEKDGYAWWKNRFAHMARYFDAYRIDHILGFFRIWTIPKEQTQGLMGYFDPAMPFTSEEIRQWGLSFDYDRMARPYITDDILNKVFQDNTPEITDKYLVPGKCAGLYDLKEAFDTQRKIALHFASQPQDQENRFICNSLTNLVANVLFVCQPGKKDAYHPRISAQFNYSYKALDENSKFVFNKLYDHFFYKRHNEFWYHQAMKKLPPLISATKMLCCAEDLGMIPDCVPPVMKELAMLSLEVQRMPKDKYRDFGDPAIYPYLCVCTTGSHDTSTLREWWEENRNITNCYFNSVLGVPGEAPFYCEPWICMQIIREHLKSPAMLCILPWQDWMSVSGKLRRENPHDERINVPAIVPHYWKYRMHMTLEELLEKKEFNRKLKNMIRESGR
ncbi:MAG: 4-alpha-glucanotransferase [Bacteroidales bacterium]|jgi:4-alpha-glucanotransferase|nr:4-alpha-glucanotransferase [Bacteroidales bacterium]MDD2264517.1 4-alpha-glucanotransferase [Bacteroidales bacterium]MDD2831752.1 4-alpha-glucanotransferase [Bacteroidales bacterium]MDD3209396.1 4-alpha-glucanotransferase [Bacteroidales bacterium]MDD3697798.1 4-alpha-glucanotransferase [Bacteroidales bacterium]